MELKKLAPWNWFSKEEHGSQLTPSRQQQTGIAPLEREFNQLIDRFFSASRGVWFEQPFQLPLETTALLKPRIDLSAREREYILSLEIPGVKEEEVKINLSNNTMTITGEKRQEHEEKRGNYYRMERSYGSFQRILSLPEDVDQENIKASFKRGVLTVTMPRRRVSEASGKIIEIN
ncbi:Hsp20/alpha crystallin family protein [Desulfogranum mediterraneum]|uniref:Hsp20/alpha crystallin family protein n=1 Tax=Desulfogranum mediterraneum TaxID=160661 RepID=UPI00040F9B89|nr:Hsp20/alpha crystallin family protein [Desulfogranum mediterraneum]